MKDGLRIILVVSIFFVVLLCFVTSVPASGQRTMLDRTFGNNGIKVVHVKNVGDIARGVYVLPDDKLLVAGVTDVPVVVKFLANGLVDSSFGMDGISFLPRGGKCVTRQTDGKILTAGTYSPTSGGGPQFGIARLHPNGSLDTSFNHIGYASHQLFSSTDVCNAMAMQADGKILLAGDGAYYPIFVRLHSNGLIDSTFGNNGKVVDPRLGHEVQIESVLIQSDGKFVAVGNVYNVAQITRKNDFVLLRYYSSGNPDSTFGVNGIVTTDFGFYDFAFAAAMQSDGKVLAAGIASDQPGTGDDFAVARYNNDGSPDTTFGDVGIVTTDVDGSSQSDLAYAITLQPDGNILLGGRTNAATRTFAIARYRPTGRLDSAWGNNGRVKTNIGGYEDELTALAIQSDSKIVAVGSSVDVSTVGITNTPHFVLARYYGDASVTVPATSQGSNRIVVFPNPTNGDFVVRCTDIDGPFTISISNVLGQIIYTESFDHGGPGKQIRLGEGVPFGVYTLQIRNNVQVLCNSRLVKR
jgi:uncharacterized delta-60 repeat protein